VGLEVSGARVPAPVAWISLERELHVKRVITAAAIVCYLAFTIARAAEEEEPKLTIKDVMKLHKAKLNEKFAAGKASKEEKQKLQEGYEALLENKPPKGDEDAWKEKVEALIAAVKDDDKEAYVKAVNCAACHGAHKPG
jgi:hypothetical protein